MTKPLLPPDGQTEMAFGGSGITESLFDYIRNILPDWATILELGSGDVSTQYLSQFYTLFSVEDKIEWVKKHKSTYIYAPLVIGWYDLRALKMSLPLSYDLILVDGPTGEGNRNGFLRHITLFNTSVPIIFDDTNRPGEHSLAQLTAEVLGHSVSWHETFAVVMPPMK